MTMIEHHCFLLAVAVSGVSGLSASLSTDALSPLDLQKWQKPPPKVLTVDYAGLHPFETLAKERYHRLSLIQEEEPKDHEMATKTINNDIRNIQINPRENYENIRITVNTDHLDELAAQDPSISQHVEYAKSTVLPKAVSTWEQILQVYPINQALTVPPGFTNVCGGITGTFKNTDLILNVIGYTHNSTNGVSEQQGTPCSNGQTLAASYACALDQFDRPILGVINLCFDELDLSFNYQGGEGFIDTIVHEIAHVLGFTSELMPYYYNPDTGLPRTQRPIPVQNVTCVDGIVREVLLPSTDTLRESFFSSNGYDVSYYEITTPTVTAVARNQFHCFNISGGRLEDEPTNPYDCFGSHWDQRLYDTEIMSPVFHGQPRLITPLTLALFEDSGWYVANYSMAQVASFGHGAGCDFVNKECIVNGMVPSYSDNFFCAENDMEGCNSDYTAVARCEVAVYNNNLPVEFQYFDQPNVGGIMPQLDFCPVYSTIALGDGTHVYGDFVCTNSSLEQYGLEFEKFGPESRCFETNFNSPICLTTRCNDTLQAVQIIFDNEEVYTCEFDGQETQIPGYTSRIVKCPRLELICPNLICPANCAGRGICDYTSPNRECVCNDVNDPSPMCANSPQFTSNEVWHNFVPSPDIPTVSPTNQHPTLAPTDAPSAQPSVSFSPSAVPTALPTTSGAARIKVAQQLFFVVFATICFGSIIA